jgi:transposase
MGRNLHRRELRSRKKGGLFVGKTKRGKGTKWMVLVDGQGIPVGAHLDSASPAEVKLVEKTLDAVKVRPTRPGRPLTRLVQRMVGDKAYDSDPLRAKLAARGIELIAPPRKNRKAVLQDGRPLRRYKRRWKVERTFAWMGNFRRLVVRYDRSFTMYCGFFHLACLIITLRHL